MDDKPKPDTDAFADVVDLDAFLKAMEESDPAVVSIDTGEKAPPDGRGE